MTTGRRVWAIVLTLVLGWAAGAVTVGAIWLGYSLLQTHLRPTSVWSQCEVDADQVRVCVHRSTRFGEDAGRDAGSLDIYRYVDGNPGGRYLSYPWPFGPGPSEADVSVDGQRVTVSQGTTSATYDYDSLAN
ncbi:hypothetical protein [Janibacter sp. GXQ6167]|uniref:hypothetical protein n=1 Tax=Janibacter sp. GXQ6167 TaxID=3240791 RepID=UPI003525D010